MASDDPIPLVVPPNLMDWGYRLRYLLEYGYAVPCEQALAALLELSPIIEIGAGGGYWAQLLRQRGADVLAFDEEPNPHHNNFIGRQWGGVDKAPPTIAAEHPDRTLLLIWPPPDSSMASDALASYGGGCVAYIGEGRGAVDADDRFFDLLDAGWDKVWTVAIPRWAHMNDRLEIYRRRVK